MQIQQDEELKLIVAAMEGLIGIVVFNARDNMWEIYTEKTFLRSQIAPSYDKHGSFSPSAEASLPGKFSWRCSKIN